MPTYHVKSNNQIVAHIQAASIDEAIVAYLNGRPRSDLHTAELAPVAVTAKSALPAPIAPVVAESATTQAPEAFAAKPPVSAPEPEAYAAVEVTAPVEIPAEPAPKPEKSRYTRRGK